MADVKDKTITAESLKALHDYNKDTYMTKILSEEQYGDELPEAGTVGRIFFKKLVNDETV